MSGAAWLSANLFALIAVYLRSRDRRGWAFAVAIVAGVSYGTGLMAWPAVIATGVSRRPLRDFFHRRRRGVVLVLALRVALVWRTRDL